MTTLPEPRILLLSLLAAACSDNKTIPATPPPSADELAQVIVADMRGLDSVPSQCTPVSSVGETLLVVVSEEVCLGCLNLGWFIREFRRKIHGNVTVVAAGSVKSLARDFIVREKTNVTRCVAVLALVRVTKSLARDFIVREKTGAVLALVRDTTVVRWQPTPPVSRRT